MTISRTLRRLTFAALVLAAGCTPEEGPSMRPGSDCLECHGGGSGGGEEGPAFTLAGTVYDRSSGTGDGVRGVAVRVTDATGRTVTLRSQAVGNFYLRDGLTFPLQVSVERNGRVETMPDPVRAGEGSCNRCHHPGDEGSIAAP